MSVATENEIVSDAWIEELSEELHLSLRGPAPYTIGEAVHELVHWAKVASKAGWTSSNIESLRDDVHQLREVVGPHLQASLESKWRSVETSLPKPGSRAPDTETRNQIIEAGEAFLSAWHSPDCIQASFSDLCEVAEQGRATSRTLRICADLLASQLLETTRKAWTVLREVTEALSGEVRVLQGHLPGVKEGDKVPTAVRLQVANHILRTGPRKGRVVVWTVYRRAQFRQPRRFGPILLMQANWALLNSDDDRWLDPGEREELRQLLHESWAASDLRAEFAEHGEQLVLARIDLGERIAAGAVEEASRRIDALVGIAVEQGGVSWERTGANYVLVNDAIVSGSGGRFRRVQPTGDSYGLTVTADVLEELHEPLSDAMASRPMPDWLIEALSAMREAGMTKHRDVTFYGARAVTPRLATALEDHAVEQIAAGALLRVEELRDALDSREVAWRFEQSWLSPLCAPLDYLRHSGDDGSVHELYAKIGQWQGGEYVISVGAVVAAQDEIRALPMRAVDRTDFERSMQVITDVRIEEERWVQVSREVKMFRQRHRRVRNAVTHGNPLGEKALNSVRDYGQRHAREALSLALRGFAEQESIATILGRGAEASKEEAAARARGESIAERAQAHDSLSSGVR